jgi:dipeptidyl aminopeptidase/acylaminoacyl peptidase
MDRGAVCLRSIGTLAFLAAVALTLTPAPLRSERPQNSQAAAAAPLLSPEQTLRRYGISDLQLSPDEKHVAFVVTEPVKGSDQRRNIWLLDTGTGAAVRHTASEKSDSRPRWSPDGRCLAFVSNRADKAQVYTIRIDGGEAQALTESKTGVQSFEWSPDGRQIAFSAKVPNTDPEDKKLKEKDDAKVVDRDGKNSPIYLIDLQTRKVRQLSDAKWRISSFAWAPQGDRLILSANDAPLPDWMADRVYALGVGDGKMRELAAPRGPFGAMRISPDGRSMAYMGSRGDGPDPHDLLVMPIDGGPAANLTASAIDRPVGAFVWLRDGGLLASVTTGFSRAFYTVTVDGKAWKLRDAPVPPSGAFCAGAEVMAYVAESSTIAPELWLSRKGGVGEKVTQFNKEWDSIPLSKLEIIRYRSSDGREVEAGILKPAGYRAGTKVPFIVMVHGGPTGSWSDRFDRWGQLLAARGFAILYPNIRGSLGYGHEFVVSNRYDWGGGDWKDVMAAVDYAIGQGLADPEHLGIGGWSYGGYMAAWAVTQTTRFKASVSGAPMTDLASEFGTESADVNIGDTWALGTPYENLELFTGRSPVTFVRNVKTPILLLNGEEDTTDPLGQVQQFYRGLKRYKVECELVTYPREGHGIREEKHELDVLNRVIGWFERYLGRQH